MGLSMSTSDVVGNKYKQCYLMVGKVRIDWYKKDCRYSLLLFKNQKARQSDARPFMTKNFLIQNEDFAKLMVPDSLDIAGMNVIKALYLHAKEQLKGNDISDVDPD